MIGIPIVMSVFVIAGGLWLGNKKENEGHSSQTDAIVPWAYRFGGCGMAFVIWFIYFAVT